MKAIDGDNPSWAAYECPEGDNWAYDGEHGHYEFVQEGTCLKCGEWFASHNDDGSCITD